MGAGQNVKFDIDKSVSLEGNSGPYIQYTFARTQSVLSKVKNKLSFARPGLAKLETEELSLLRTLYRFEDVIEEAGKNFAPNLLCNYLFDLSRKFNLFYAKYKIIGSDNEDFRILLTSAVSQVIKNGLNLLGIKSPERM